MQTMQVKDIQNFIWWDLNGLFGCDDRATVYHDHSAADIYSLDRYNQRRQCLQAAQIDRPGQTHKMISQETAELQETIRAGSFLPASLQWTGSSRQLVLRQINVRRIVLLCHFQYIHTSQKRNNNKNDHLSLVIQSK